MQLPIPQPNSNLQREVSLDCQFYFPCELTDSDSLGATLFRSGQVRVGGRLSLRSRFGLVFRKNGGRLGVVPFRVQGFHPLHDQGPPGPRRLRVTVATIRRHVGSATQYSQIKVYQLLCSVENFVDCDCLQVTEALTRRQCWHFATGPRRFGGPVGRVLLAVVNSSAPGSSSREEEHRRTLRPWVGGGRRGDGSWKEGTFEGFDWRL